VKLIIQTDKDNDACYLGFTAASADAGSVKKTVRVSEDIALDFDAAGRLVGLDVMNASQALREDFADIQLDALIGVKEAAQLLKVQPPKLVRDHASKPDFPQPVSELASGRVWLRSQVEQYAEKRRIKTAKTPAA
jgi:uncharacterized protein YuzE